MKGKVKLSVKNKHITFSFILERNVTIVTGDSGTGKTKLINMIRNYSELGKASGVTLNCDKQCLVLSGRNWENELENTHDSIVFVEESTPFLTSYDFAKAIQKSDNYYVLVTREPLPQIPYSIDSIKHIHKNGKKPRFEKIYSDISIKDISEYSYDVIIVEDSKSGFQFYEKATKKQSSKCISSNGKSGILKLLKQYKKKKILVVADAAALGSEIRNLYYFKSISDTTIDFFLPESFEWLILSSVIFSTDPEIRNILDEPIEYIESKEYFSWEQFFTALLVSVSKGRPNLEYPQNKNILPSGYLTESNVIKILDAMK